MLWRFFANYRPIGRAIVSGTALPIPHWSYEDEVARQSVEGSGVDFLCEKFLELRLAVERLQVGIDLDEDIPSVSVLDRHLQLLDRLTLLVVQAENTGIFVTLAWIKLYAFACPGHCTLRLPEP